MAHFILVVLLSLFFSVLSATVANNGGWEKNQQLPANLAGLCMFGDFVVSPQQTMPAQGNVPVQASGVNVYAKQSDNKYALQQVLGQDLMVSDCAISNSYIVLTVFTQDNDSPVYTMHFFQRQGTSLQWKQTQTISEAWTKTNGIVANSIHVTETYLALTNVLPNPVNLGTVSLYQLGSTTGQWIQIQQISNQVDASFPLVVSIYASRLAVTGFPGLTNNATSATTIYKAVSPVESTTQLSMFKFESEMLTICAIPVLGAGNLLATSTKNGVDLYQLSQANKFVLIDSLTADATLVENRGTVSLQISPDGAFLVRRLGQYNYESSTGCVVYSIVDGKVKTTFDSYGAAPLTMKCMVGSNVFGMLIWDTANSNNVYIDIYSR